MLKQETGACIYCGQVHLIKIQEGATEHEINYEATMHCDCEESKVAQTEQANINMAAAYIESMYTDPAVKEIMAGCLDALGHGVISQIKLKKEKTTYTMTRCANKTIKVEKETKIKEKRES